MKIEVLASSHLYKIKFVQGISCAGFKYRIDMPGLVVTVDENGDIQKVFIELVEVREIDHGFAAFVGGWVEGALGSSAMKGMIL
jgi:hypothetical protein